MNPFFLFCKDRRRIVATEDPRRYTYPKARKEFIIQKLQQRAHEKPGESVLLSRSGRERDHVLGLFVEVLGGSVIIRSLHAIIVKETSSAVFTVPKPFIKRIQVPLVCRVDLL